MAAITMKDIARDLGVSVVTVSKVLRDHPDIGSATKERVLQRVKELNYTPNLMARGLVTGRTNLVAFVIPDLASSFFCEVAIHLSIGLRKHGYFMLICWTEEDPEIQMKEIQRLLSLGIDAMIVATSGDDISSFRLMESRNVPYVLLDRQVPQLKAPYVGVEDVVVGEMATQHLIDIGCKRIAHIYGPEMSPGRQRLEGYKKALQRAGLPIKESMIVIPREGGPRGIQHGFEATQRLLALRPRIDAIFAFNDPQAIGAIEAVLAAGLRVPQDVAVIGCGDLPLGRTLHVPLSTVDQNTKELGEKSAKAVLSLLRKGDKAGPVRRQMLKPRLIVRQSSDRSASKKTLAG